jgi:dolichol-phosphate mannosyltransferase
MKKLDIVIPVYNEGANILFVLESLRRKIKTPFRVLICYDFEEDCTLEAIKNYHDVEIMTVFNQKGGPHAAVTAGFRASTAAAVLMFPADDDYNAGQLDAMVTMMDGGCDIVCASRFIPGGSMTGCPWLKAVLVRTSAFVMYHVARLPTHDSSNGFRMFSRRVINSIKIDSSQGFTYSIELLVKAHRLRWKIGEVPVLWFERGEGQGKSRFKILKWLPAYLRWFFYSIATTYLRKGPNTVTLRTPS